MSFLLEFESPASGGSLLLNSLILISTRKTNLYPSLATIRRLYNQELHQLHKMPRKSRGVNNFAPIKPLRALSTDLVGFTNKQHKQYRYILSVMETFSGYLWSETLTDKTEEEVGAGLDRTLTRIKKDFGNPDFGYIISDRGGEFKKMPLLFLRSME